jgi:hypothetical protein
VLAWVFTAAGALAPIKGLNPFISSAYAEVPTGAPSSPGLIGLEFTQPMLRLEVLPRNPISSLNPAPMAQSNQTLQRVDPMLGGGFGPIEGRPPGPNWAHQRFAKLPPKVAMEVTQEGAWAVILFLPLAPATTYFSRVLWIYLDQTFDPDRS